MEKKIKLSFIVSGLLFLLFNLLTIVLLTIDVQPVGPQESRIGLATVNRFIWDHIGENLLWYHITDRIGIAAILTAVSFAILGLIQLIKRKSIKCVDTGIVLLGVFYPLIAASYLFFEICVVNFRPIMIQGELEASFPSSHSMIVLCIMATAMMQLPSLLGNKTARKILYAVCILIISVTIIGRFVSGVHWFTDILGGLLLGSAFVMLYYSVLQYIKYRQCSDEFPFH